VKNKILIMLLFISVIKLYGQDKNEIDQNKQKIKKLKEEIKELKQETKKNLKYPLNLGIYIMPCILTNHETSGYIDFTTIIGIKIRKKFFEKLSIETGLSYYKNDLYHGAWNGAPCSNPISICYIYSKTNYIEMPVLARIYYSDKTQTVNPYLSVGLINSFSIKSVNERTDVIDNNYTTTIFIDNNFKYQQSYLSAGFGTEFKLSDNIQL